MINICQVNYDQKSSRSDQNWSNIFQKLVKNSCIKVGQKLVKCGQKWS
jgi:hypothetical protein